MQIFTQNIKQNYSKNIAAILVPTINGRLMLSKLSFADMNIMSRVVIEPV